MRKLLSILSGPVTGGIIYLVFSLNNLSHPVCAMAMVTAWMALWWITEAVEIGVTSLLPFVLLPLLNIMKSDEVAFQYMEQTIFLFIGGFFLAYAMEKWDLHHRLAYRMFSCKNPCRYNDHRLPDLNVDFQYSHHIDACGCGFCHCNIQGIIPAGA